MRTFFLFYLLSYLLHNPLLALVIALAVVYFAEGRYSGRYFNPASFYTKRHTIRELERTLSVNEHDAGARNDLGRILCDEGRFAEAREHLAKAIQRMGDSAETNYFYGVSLLKTGSEEEGLHQVLAALEINPRFLYGEPQLTLARHYLNNGDPAAAEVRAAEAVKINTSSVEGWVVLARARKQQGDEAGAAQAWSSAIEAFDGLPRYLKMASRTWRNQARRELS